MVVVCRRFDPSSIGNSPLYDHHPSLSLFGNRNFLTTFFRQGHLNKTLDKQKNKPMCQSYFFMFTRLENNVICIFINNTFIKDTRLRFDQK